MKMIQPSSVIRPTLPPRVPRFVRHARCPVPRQSVPARGPGPSGPPRARPPGSPRPGPCSDAPRLPGPPYRRFARSRSGPPGMPSTQTSLAALYTAGAVPPRRPASRASATAGNASSSSGWNVQLCERVQSMAGPAPGTRSGQARPSAIGIRMSGGLAWAIVAPSVNSTIEWITDCRCTTTSIRSKPMPNSRCASISSRPLFTSVAELIVTTGPMSQFGWASAWSGVTSSSSARRRPKNGPPLAVSTSRPTSPALPPRRHWAMAECSESTGTICPGAGPAGHQRPADDQGLLVGQGQHPARVQGGQRGGQADRAGHPVQHHVAGPRGGLGDRGRAGQQLGQRPGGCPPRPPRHAARRAPRPRRPRWPPRPPRRRTRWPGRPAGPGYRRRRPARPPGTGPGCAG